ncbi:hypothetical protein DH2020_020506 [Rehmannia glutinosa]|uniref:Tf2-1-like SH3-like domain-containing protein n=1 Tax=Rehmannia glutinosa TaxID=99300 RepID=A0ABR0WK09_REHGL
MDFVMGLPKTKMGFDSIWVIVNCLTKSAHFLPVKRTYNIEKYAELYIDEIVRYQSSIGMAPYEALYGRRCRSTVYWDEIRQRMKTAQSRQKCYADKRRKPLEFSIGDMIFLKVAPMKGVIRFGKKEKLSPRCIGSFEILERVGSLAYRIALPPSLSGVHNVFHVSMIKKYIPVQSHILSYESLSIRDNLTYEETPFRIVDKIEKEIRRKKVVLVKVQWMNHTIEEAMWEHEDEMRILYPQLFDKQ